MLMTIVIGVGLALAPVAFKMFERAPLGGDMIDDFAPYMTEQKIDTFRGYMDTIGAAVDESDGLKAAVIEQGTITADDYDTQFLMVNQLADGWDAIDTDMTDLLDRMDRNMGITTTSPRCLFRVPVVFRLSPASSSPACPSRT